MNWVGGSRSRVTLKDDVKRQREFFEKRKLQQRLKNLGLPLPNSSATSTCGSMDLVTLFIVNQIAAKKDNKDPPKVAVLGSGSRAVSRQRHRSQPLVLPMSPCSPSQLSLVESQPQEHSLTRKRKHVSQLSPVLESAFSDNSASDYAPHAAEALSPFSASSPSSGHGGTFPMQLNQQQSSESQSEAAAFCPQAWGGSGPEQSLFSVFSQPRDIINPRPRSCPSSLSQLETPSAAQVLFGSPSSLETEGHVNPVVSAVLRDPSEEVPVLDFSLNQEFEEPFEDHVFRGFSNGDFTPEEDESVKSKIHLRSDRRVHPSKPQMVPERQCTELPSSTNMSFSYPGNSSCVLDEGQYSSACFSSDSSGDDEISGSEICLKTSSPSESNWRSLGTLQQLRLFPPLKHRLKIREEVTTGNEPNAMNNQNGCQTNPSGFLQSLPQTQCQCWKKRIETCETGTQTDSIGTAERADSAVQCSLMPAAGTRPPLFNLYRPHVESPVLSLSTRGQTVHVDGDGRGRESPRITGTEKRQENWIKMRKSESDRRDEESLKSEGFKQRGVLEESKGKQSGEIQPQERVTVMKTPADEMKESE